jgi:hypothetical protein
MTDPLTAWKARAAEEDAAYNRLVELVEEVDGLAVPLLRPRHLETMVQEYAYAALAAVQDLAKGVFIAAGAQSSGGNAMRLARHLMEHEWDMAYVFAADTPARCQQRIATDTRKVLALIDRDWRTMMGSDLDDLKQAVLDAEAREAAAGGRRKASYTDRRQVPDFQALAHSLGRGEEYDGYRALSAVAHPGWASYLLCSGHADDRGAVLVATYNAHAKRRASFHAARHFALAVMHAQRPLTGLSLNVTIKRIVEDIVGVGPGSDAPLPDP